MLFLPENQVYLEAFVRYGHEFCNKNVAQFVAVATPEMMKNYFEMGYLLDNASQDVMVRRFDMDVLRRYMEYDMPCECVQNAVLDRFSHEDKILFAECAGRLSCRLSASAEKRLFDCSALTLIAAFVHAGGVFSDEGECALVRLGIQELTDAYFSQHEPSAEAAALLDRKTAEF